MGKVKKCPKYESIKKLKIDSTEGYRDKTEITKNLIFMLMK